MLFKDFSNARNYRKGQIILPQGFLGQAMGLVETGQVEIFSKTVDGEETVYRVLGANETFGVGSLFDNQARHTGVRALTKARVAVMDRRDLIRRTHNNPQLAFDVLRTVCQRIKEMGEESQRKDSKVSSDG